MHCGSNAIQPSLATSYDAETVVNATTTTSVSVKIKLGCA